MKFLSLSHVGSVCVLCGLAQNTLLWVETSHFRWTHQVLFPWNEMCRAVELLGAVPAMAPESTSQDVILWRPQAGPWKTTSPTDSGPVWELEVTLGPLCHYHSLTYRGGREKGGARHLWLPRWPLEVIWYHPTPPRTTVSNVGVWSFAN